MPGAGRHVETMQIVRHDAVAKQSFAEPAELIGVVVDIFQQNSLIEKHDAGKLEFTAGGLDGMTYLVGVITVHDDRNARPCGIQCFN